MSSAIKNLPLILVVDDNPINLRVVGAELKHSNKYRVIFASNGPDALEQANSTIPDLILLDIMMPDMSGY
ncbi:MAG TPA: response regulator, partial [Gammaproteobacteria bacterium]|nr:response regulator [Gammaproteobacteria bacterium]